MKPSGSKWILPAVLAVCAFAADYYSKSWANSALTIGNSLPFLPGFLRFTLTRNTGGAFGIGRGNALFMTVLAISIVLGIVFWFWKREHSDDPPTGLERSGVALIISAALGNLFDRFTRGEVTDFLEFTFIDFPIFNVADALIDLGAFLVVLGALSVKKKAEPQKEAVD